MLLFRTARLQPTATNHNRSLSINSASVPSDSDGFAENPDAYKVWKPQPVEGEAGTPAQFWEKLTAMTGKLSMPQPQKSEREPKDELEELNYWLADPILRGEAMARVMKGELLGAALRERYSIEFDEQRQPIQLVEMRNNARENC